MSTPRFSPLKVSIILHNGDVYGAKTARIDLCTIKAVFFPRHNIGNLKGLGVDLAVPGVYLLIGNERESGNYIYVGKSDNLQRRLYEQNRKYSGKALEGEGDSAWEYVVAFMNTDGSLNTGHYLYIEAGFLNIIKKSILVNGLDNRQLKLKAGALSKEEKAIADKYIEQARTLATCLGFDIFKSAPTQEEGMGASASSETRESDSATFEFDGKKRLNAQISVDSQGELRLLKGSQIRSNETDSCPASVKAIRKSMLDEGILVLQDGHDAEQFYLLKEDFDVKSASAAAGIVYGGSINGHVVWKMKGSAKAYGTWLAEKTPSTGDEDEAIED